MWGQSPTLKGPLSKLVSVLAGIAAFLLWVQGCKSNAVSALATAPPNVDVATVIQRDVPIYHEWVATLDGFVNAQIQPQVSGYLVQQTYQEGQLVRKNQILFKIDPRPFQAILDQAKAQLAQAEAQLGKKRKSHCPKPA